MIYYLAAFTDEEEEIVPAPPEVDEILAIAFLHNPSSGLL
jgi:hypothetical protein